MKKSIAIMLAFLIIISFTSCKKAATEPELKRYTANFLGVFDTVTTIIGYAENEEGFSEIVNTIKLKLEKYHKQYDIYNEYEGIANLKTINDSAGGAPVTVDKEVIDLLELGKTVFNDTKGYTNIAMGSVLKIWHDYRVYGIDNPEEAKIPDMKELEEAAMHMSIEDLIINTTESTVQLKDPNMSIDVGSLAKGYATERVALWLEDNSYDNILLSVGGNVRAVGKRLDGTFWEVGIENPYGEKELMGIALLDNNALVISGNYQRYYTVDGKRYHHIINPKTLMPENYSAAVAIICNDSGLADAYTTVLYNLPIEEGKEWEKDFDIDSMWMLENKEIVYDNEFKQNLKKDK